LAPENLQKMEWHADRSYRQTGGIDKDEWASYRQTVVTNTQAFQKDRAPDMHQKIAVRTDEVQGDNTECPPIHTHEHED